MKYIKILEKYAYSVDGFPFEDLEVDYHTTNNDKVIVTIYWTGINGETQSKDVASSTLLKFQEWVYTSSAKRYIRSKVAFIGGLDETEVLTMRDEVKSRVGRKIKPMPPYTVVLDGETINVDDHEAFCHHNKLNRSLMRKVVSGTVRSHKGYHLPTTDAEEVVVYNRDTPRVFINRNTGDIVATNNVSQFCKKYGLYYPSFKKILQGRKVTSEWQYMGVEE